MIISLPCTSTVIKAHRVARDNFGSSPLTIAANSFKSCWRELEMLVNSLYTNGFFLLNRYKKIGIVYCTYYLGVSGYNFQEILYFLSEDLFFCINKQCRYWWNAALCCISSGSSLFVKVLVMVFPIYKWLSWTLVMLNMYYNSSIFLSC